MGPGCDLYEDLDEVNEMDERLHMLVPSCISCHFGDWMVEGWFKAPLRPPPKARLEYQRYL